MTNISSYFEQAELALAAYSGLTKDMKGVPYTTALKDDDKGMTEAQAARFASTWRVVDQYNDPLTGLSATVFEKTVIIDNVEVKQYSLAIRGTDGVMDLLSNSFIVNGIPPEISPQYLSLKAKVQTWLADPQKLQGKNFTVTVTVTGNAGRDTIIDVDGLGQLVINNQSLTTGSAFLSRDDSFGRMAA